MGEATEQEQAEAMRAAVQARKEAAAAPAAADDDEEEEDDDEVGGGGGGGGSTRAEESPEEREALLGRLPLEDNFAREALRVELAKLDVARPGSAGRPAVVRALAAAQAWRRFGDVRWDTQAECAAAFGTTTTSLERFRARLDGTAQGDAWTRHSPDEAAPAAEAPPPLLALSSSASSSSSVATVDAPGAKRQRLPPPRYVPPPHGSTTLLPSDREPSTTAHMPFEVVAPRSANAAAVIAAAHAEREAERDVVVAAMSPTAASPAAKAAAAPSSLAAGRQKRARHLRDFAEEASEYVPRNNCHHSLPPDRIACHLHEALRLSGLARRVDPGPDISD